jgi:hypothetical protein
MCHPLPDNAWAGGSMPCGHTHEEFKCGRGALYDWALDSRPGQRLALNAPTCHDRPSGVLGNVGRSSS